MVRNLLLLGSGVFWAVMMWLLVEREILPYFEYHQPPTYRGLLRDTRAAESRRYAIQFGTELIGEAESLTSPQEDGTLMRTRMWMRSSAFSPFPLPDDLVTLRNDVRVDEDYRLRELELRARMSGIKVRVDGRREGEEQFRVKYNLLLLKDEHVLDLPEEGMLSNDFLPFQGGTSLRVGKKWKVRMLDVGDLYSLRRSKKLTPRELYAMVDAREVVECLGGRRRMAFRVLLRRDPTEEVPSYTAWVDEEGVVVRQERILNKRKVVIVLEERRKLSEEAASDFEWTVELPER